MHDERIMVHGPPEQQVQKVKGIQTVLDTPGRRRSSQQAQQPQQSDSPTAEQAKDARPEEAETCKVASGGTG
jgi:hypothetical protein